MFHFMLHHCILFSLDNCSLFNLLYSLLFTFYTNEPKLFIFNKTLKENEYLIVDIISMIKINLYVFKAC